MPPRVDTKLVAERDTDLIVKRPNLDTRTPGKSVIAKALPSDHIEVRGSGADAGTGDVSFWLKKTGVKPGLYNQFKTDAYGRIIEASYVENAGSGSSTDTIWNQSTAAQDANFWIDGNGRVDGSLVAGSLTTGSLSVTGAVTFSSLTLSTPLSTSSGGTGVATVAAELFFAGPVSGVDASPSWRAIAASDLPPIPFSFITSLPNTLALHGITDGVTLDTVQSISGVKTFGTAPLMSAGLEFASGAPASTANKLYQVSSTLYWNGVAVGSTYSLPVASSSTLGGVKVGAGISVAGDGTLSVAALTRRQLFTVGNGTDTAFNLAHNFSTTGVSVSIRKATGTRSQVVFDNYLTPGNETNAVTVTFPTAPATGEYEVTIIADNAVLESSHPLSGLSDVSFSGLVAGQALVYNGSSWSNASVMTTNDAILNANVHTEIQWNARQNASMRINGIVQGGAFAVCDPSASSDVEYTWQHQNGWFYAALETNNDFALGPYQDVSGSAQRHPAMRVKVSGFQPYRIDFLAPLTIVDGTPSVTTNALYSVGGALYWNGSAIGATANMVTTDTAQNITGEKTFSVAGALKAYDLTVNTGDIYVDYTDAGSNVHAYGFNFRFNGVYRSIFRWNEQYDRFELLTRDNSGFLRDNRMTIPRTSSSPTEFNAAGGVQISQGGILLASSVPASTALRLYCSGSTLYWNGSAVGATANMVTTDTTQTITGAKTFSTPPTSLTRVSEGNTGALNTLMYCDTSNTSVFVNSIGNSVVITGTGAGGRAQTGQIVYSVAGTVSSSTYLASFMSAHQCYGVAGTTVNAKTYGFRTTIGGSASNVLTMTQDYADFAVEDEGQAGSVVLARRYGLKINTSVFAPSTAYFGVYVGDMPVGTPSAYAFYSGNGNVRVGGGIELASFTPSATANKLYNVAGALHWNGAPVGGSAAFVPSTVRSVTFSANANADSAYINNYSRVTPSATSLVLTIPQSLGSVNDEIIIEQVGSNMLTISAGSGITFRPPGISSFRPRVDGSAVTLKCVFKDGSTSTWTIIGDYV